MCISVYLLFIPPKCSRTLFSGNANNLAINASSGAMFLRECGEGRPLAIDKQELARLLFFITEKLLTGM